MGFPALNIIKQIQKEAVELDVESSRKLKIIEACAEIEFRMVVRARTNLSSLRRF